MTNHGAPVFVYFLTQKASILKYFPPLFGQFEELDTLMSIFGFIMTVVKTRIMHSDSMYRQ